MWAKVVSLRVAWQLCLVHGQLNTLFHRIEICRVRAGGGGKFIALTMGSVKEPGCHYTTLCTVLGENERAAREGGREILAHRSGRHQ